VGAQLFINFAQGQKQIQRIKVPEKTAKFVGFSMLRPGVQLDRRLEHLLLACSAI
jgi:hypothetical protein